MIKSIRSSLDVLNCFSSETPKIGVTEISRKLRLSKSTVSRILSTLQQGNLVAKASTDQKFQLGPKVVELAHIFLSTIDWRTVAAPHLKELRDKTDETVMIFVMDGDQRICLEKFESSHELRPSLSIGSRFPLHAGSAGKLLLAYLPKEDRRKILSRTGLPRFTMKTTTTLKKLERDLDQIRRSGYAVSHQERVPFLSSVSAPMRDSEGHVIAALCVDGLTARFTPRKVARFVELATETALRISREMGFHQGSATED
jgi:DNA-binding IclR family transcriptional regulator